MKHTSLISLQNVRGGNSSSHDSKTRKPAVIKVASQSPDNSNPKVDLKNQKSEEKKDSDKRTMKLQLKEPQSYQIPTFTGLQSAKSATNSRLRVLKAAEPNAQEFKQMVVEIKDTQSEIIKLIATLQDTGKVEQQRDTSKERI